LEERTLLTATPVPLGSPADGGVLSADQDVSQDGGDFSQWPPPNKHAEEILTISNSPGAVTAGKAFQFTLTVTDKDGHVETNFTGMVHFSSTTDPRATLPPDYTFTLADAGAHTFAVTARTAGSFVLIVSDTSDNSVQAKLTATVNAAPADHFDVGGPPSAVGSGVGFTVTVTARDPFGNVDTRYAGTVHFSSSDGQALLPDDGTLTNGSGHFYATLRTVGNQTITATDMVHGSVTGSATLGVTAVLEEVFVVGVDSQVYGHKVDAAGNTTGGYFLARPGQVKALAVGRDAQGDPEVFVLGLDNQVYALTFDASGNAVGGYSLFAAGAVKAVAAGHDAANVPEIFATGLDGQVYAAKPTAAGSPASGYTLTRPGRVRV
jgi:hypothetical protein